MATRRKKGTKDYIEQYSKAKRILKDLASNSAVVQAIADHRDILEGLSQSPYLKENIRVQMLRVKHESMKTAVEKEEYRSEQGALQFWQNAFELEEEAEYLAQLEEE